VSQKVGKTWGFAGWKNHGKFLYLEQGQNESLYNEILPFWKMKTFASWLNPGAK